jgi:exodeoxyribonuclease V alpha subunit
LSRCVNAGDGNAVLTILKNTKFPDVSFSVLPSPHALGAEIEKIIIQGFSSYFATKNSVDAFELFKKFRILCAVRIGHYGVVSMNQLVEKILAARGLIPASATSYSHRPVLINTNDYNLKLFNGDTGIMLPDPEAKNGLRVFFEDKDGEFRKFLALRLPANETVYAMTIHKSQGSEFDNVLLVLPDRDYPVLTRELLYTGVTRAKNHVHIIGTDELVLKTVSRRLSRTSGLRDALWMKE